MFREKIEISVIYFLYQCYKRKYWFGWIEEMVSLNDFLRILFF